MQSAYATRNTENISHFKTKHKFLKNSLFPSAPIEWNNLDHNIWNVGTFSTFKNNIPKSTRPTPNNIFNCESRRGIKLITRLCVGLSHLGELKVKHSFQDTLTPICSRAFDVKPTSHCILHYSMYNDERHTLLSTINNIDCRLVDVAETVFILKLFSWCSN